ncbi:MAG TPA: cohesin domain-containing protein [Xanthomonadaceae bacterium]
MMKIRTRILALLALSPLLVMAGEYRDANKAFERGEYVEAIRLYRKAAEEAPDNVGYQQRYLLRKDEALQAIFEAAEQARRSGDLSAAETFYQNALQVDPLNSAAKDWMRRIADIRRHDEALAKVDELIASGALVEAEKMVRSVLAESPESSRATNSMERIRDAMRKERIVKTDDLEDRYRKPVTLEFRDVPVKVAFEVLSKASGINFVYDQEIRPDLKVTVFLRKTPLNEAIRMIGLSTQLETRAINENSILVFPNTPQKVGEYRPLSVRSFYLQNTDAKRMAETLKTLLKTESIVVDEKLNMIVMRDSEDAIGLAAKIVSLHDIGEPEVMLDVEILEVKQSKLMDLGVSLPSEIGVSLVAPGQTSNSMPIRRLRDLDSSNVYALIPNAAVRLKDERSGAKILANPKIRVKTREKASVLIGDRVPVITSTSTSTGFVSETVNYVDVGLKLEVEPSIYAGDDVSIKINLEVSNLVREIVSRSGTLSYQIGTRNAQTTLRLRDGETQVLAGLINKEDRKVASGLPWISRFPVLNRIFGSQKNDRQNTEIVLSITPRLIRGVRSMDLEDMHFASGTASRLMDVEHVGREGGKAVNDDPMPRRGDGLSEPAAPAAPGVDQTPSGGMESSATVSSPAQTATDVELKLRAPESVRAGEQFTLVLDLTATRALEQLPLMIGYDPQALQLVGVQPGELVAGNGRDATLNHQVDHPSGKISATAAWSGNSMSGQGTLLQVTFKAISQSDKATIRLLSAAPVPAGAAVKTQEINLEVR